MYSIFSIDDDQNPLRMNQFNNWLSDYGISAKPVIGSYKGKPERSWLVRKVDFDRFVRHSHMIAGQETVMHVAQGNKMETVLEYLTAADGHSVGDRVGLGCMHEVDEQEARENGAYSYLPERDVFWIARPGNPDRRCVDDIKREAEAKRIHDEAYAAGYAAGKASVYSDVAAVAAE